MKTKLVTIILLALAMAFNVDAQTRRTTAKRTGTTRTTATVKKKTAPKVSAIAKLTVDKNVIYLLKGGKIKCSNPNIVGSWNMHTDRRNGMIAYELHVANKQYDGGYIFIIPEQDDAYQIFLGSIDCEVKNVDLQRYVVTVETVCYEDDEDGTDVINLSDITPIKVTWLK